MSVSITFPEDQLKMLVWLFNDGFEDARHNGLLRQIDEMHALEPRVGRLKANVSASFDPEEVRALARAVDIGRDRHFNVIHSDRMTAEKAAIDQLLSTLVAAESHSTDSAQWAFDPGIADAIVSGRILNIPSLKGMAEHSMGAVLSETLWENLEAKWKQHDRMSTAELQNHLRN